jgi:hypothetical protein
MNLSHFVRTERSYRTIYWFCFVVQKHNSPIRYASWAKHSHWMNLWVIGDWIWAIGDWLWDIGYRLWAICDWQLAIGNWLLAIGDWLLNLGGKAAYPCLYTLHSTLYTKSDNDHTLSLIPYRLFPAKGSVLTQMPSADAGAVRSSAGQNLRRVRRTLHFDHREINSVNSSKNI